MPEIIPSNFAYAPLFAEPRLQFVFFNVRRTLSCEIVSMTSNCTSLSAIICRVHRPYPSGGSLQAIIVTCASTLVSIFMGRPLRGASCSISRMGSSAFCRYFVRTLCMVPRETRHVVVTSFSDRSSSKSNKTRALFMARALLLPWATNFSHRSRSAAVKRTAGDFFGILLSSL